MNTDVLETAVIGASYAGKSTLCNAIDYRPINNVYTSTIGIDYIMKKINNDVSIGLWDLAGIEKFTNIVSHYVKISIQAVFCYSSENYQSYLDMVDKYEYYKKTDCLKNKPIFVVATKIDSNKSKLDYKKWSRDFVHYNNLTFIATSSYSTEGLEELAHILADKRKFIDKKKLVSLDIDEFEPLIPLILEEKPPKYIGYLRCCI